MFPEETIREIRERGIPCIRGNHDHWAVKKCGGPMRLVAVIEAPAVIEKILRHLGLWSRGPPRGRRVVVESVDREPPSMD